MQNNCRYVIDVKKQTGENVEPSTITSYARAIINYIKDSGRDINYEDFKSTKKVLAAKRKDLKQQGMGNQPNKATYISPADEEKMWSSYAIGTGDPEALLHGLWFVLTKQLGFRGSHEARQLKWGDFTWDRDDSEIHSIEWKERSSKTRDGVLTQSRAFAPKLFPNRADPYRCPINLMRMYQTIRPEGTDDADSPFFLAINYKFESGKRQFKKNPMGQERIAQVMSRIAARAGLRGRYTNHSVRRTECTDLLNGGVSPLYAAQLTGHRDPNSLKHYVVADQSMQQHMSKILQGGYPELRAASIQPSSAPVWPLENVPMPESSSSERQQITPPNTASIHPSSAYSAPVLPRDNVPVPASSEEQQATPRTTASIQASSTSSSALALTNVPVPASFHAQSAVNISGGNINFHGQCVVHVHYHH